jgi:hypothetical protein
LESIIILKKFSFFFLPIFEIFKVFSVFFLWQKLKIPLNKFMQMHLIKILVFLFSWPSKDSVPAHLYLNKGVRTRFLALKPDTALVFAVDQLAYILNQEKVRTIIKIEFDKPIILEKLKQSCLEDRVRTKWLGSCRFFEEETLPHTIINSNTHQVCF